MASEREHSEWIPAALDGAAAKTQETDSEDWVVESTPTADPAVGDVAGEPRPGDPEEAEVTGIFRRFRRRRDGS